MKRFIVIDGLDGAGKDTQAELLKKRYIDMNETVILRSHPAQDNPYGRQSKKALLTHSDSKWPTIVATWYYLLDILRSLIKYYGKADTVIFCRYAFAVAYLPKKIIPTVNKLVRTLLPMSSHMFFLDVSPEESLRRMDDRDSKEIFETPEKLRKVRRKSLIVVNKWNIIDGNLSIEEVHSQICTACDNLDVNNNLAPLRHSRPDAVDTSNID